MPVMRGRDERGPWYRWGREGKRYRYTPGDRRSREAARRKAAAQGHTDAQFAVGMAYTTGEGIGKDPAEAMRWFIAAATRGLEDAREIIVLLGNDPAFDTLQEFPELLQYDWYGQQGAIKKDLVNVRQSPGTDSPILAKLNQGDRVRIVQQRNDWSRVVLPAISPDSKSVATGWIFTPLIRISN